MSVTAQKGWSKDRDEGAVSWPLVVLVINRENQETFVYPPSGLEAFLSEPAAAAFRSALPGLPGLLPVPQIPKALATPVEVNALAAPLAARSAVYVQTIMRELRGVSLVSSDPWSTAVLKTVTRTGAIGRPQERLQEPVPGADNGGSNQATLVRSTAYAWPPSVPFLMTILAQPSKVLGSSTKGGSGYRQGILVVIECRADSAAGVVEQIDLLGFRDGRLARTYWNRDALDPTYFVKTDVAFSQAVGRFKTRLASLAPVGGASHSETVPQETIELALHRVLPESARSAAFRTLKVVEPAIKSEPVPSGVDQDYVRYRTDVPVERIKAVRDALVETGASFANGFVMGSLAAARDTRENVVILDPPTSQSSKNFQKPQKTDKKN